MSLHTAEVSIYPQILPYLLYTVDFWIPACLHSHNLLFHGLTTYSKWIKIPHSHELRCVLKHTSRQEQELLYYGITCFIMCVCQHITNKQCTLNPGALMPVLVGMVLYAPHFRSWIMSTCTPSSIPNNSTILNHPFLHAFSLYCFSFSLTKCIYIIYCYLVNHCLSRNSYFLGFLFLCMHFSALYCLQSEPEDCNPVSEMEEKKH